MPILLGHSDGASIALIHAAASERAVRGLIVMAPHTMVEGVAIRGIEITKRIIYGGSPAPPRMNTRERIRVSEGKTVGLGSDGSSETKLTGLAWKNPRLDLGSVEEIVLSKRRSLLQSERSTV